jgi:tape measure domain-containing protein
MARKDVDLVIRAKNEATKAIDAIGQAFVALNKNAEAGVKGAARVDSTLGNLVKSLGDLGKAFGNASGAQKFATELGAATTALGKLEAESATLAANQQRLKVELDQSTASTARLRSETQEAATALKNQGAAIEQAKAQQSALSAELRAGVTARNVLQNADERMVDKIDKAAAKLEQQKARFAELSATLAGTAEPTNTFRNRVEAAGEAVAKQEAKVAKLSAAYIANRAATEQAIANVAGLKAGFDSAAGSIDKQQAALADTAARYSGLKAATREALTTQKGFEAALNEAGNAANQQSTKVDAARAAIKTIGEQSIEATTRTAELNAVAGKQLGDTFTAQRRSTLEGVRALKEMQDQAKALALQLRDTANPAKELTDKFNAMRVAIRQQKAEVQTNRLAGQNIGQALQSTGPAADASNAFQLAGGSIQEASSKIAGLRSQLQGAIADARATAAATSTVAQAAAGAAASIRGAGAAGKEAGDAGATGTNGWASAFRNLYGEGRSTLSFMQRLRGEVLSLVAAYVGFQAAVQGIKNIVKANTELETAQSRLNVAFESKPERVAAEYDFIRRNANRLGIEVGTLAGEYGKFAIATQGTNLEGDKTRKIFLAVAEAGKVNKTSLEDLKGTFLALTQIVSKGQVMSEELKGQLGERLPGAVKLFADALGKTTLEFIQMLEKGEVSSDMLDKFADALNKKFGPALGAALESTSAQIGFFENNLQKAFLVMGQSGAIEGFTKFLKDLNGYFESSAGVTFFQRIGGAVGTLFDALRFLLDNIRLVSSAMGALLAIKLIPFFLGLGKSVKEAGTSLAAIPGQVTTAVAATSTLSTATGGLSIAVGVLRNAFIGLRVAITAAFSATLIGFFITALGTALGYMLTSTNDATDGLVKQNKTIDQLRDAYDRFKDKPKELAEALGKISKTDAEVGLKRAAEEAKKLNDALTANPFSYFKQATGTYTETERQILALQAQVKDGTLSIDDFKKKVDDLAQADPKLDRNLVVQLLEAATKAKDARNNVDLASAAVAGVAQTATTAQQTLLGLGKTFASVSKSAEDGKKILDSYHDSLEAIMGLIPNMSAELKKLKDLKTIDEKGNEALGAAIKSGDFNKVRDLLNTVGQARIAVDEGTKDTYLQQYKQGNFGGRGSATAEQLQEIVVATSKLAEKMGLSAQDLLTAMSYETGGSLNPEKVGPTTKNGVQRGLFQAGDVQQKELGGIDFKNVQDQIDKFGTYLEKRGVKAGDSLLQIYAAINAGNAKNTEARDAAQGGAPGTVRDKVDTQMEGHKARAAALLEYYKSQADQAKKEEKDEEKAQERADKYHETLKGQIETRRLKTEDDKVDSLESAQQLAVQREIEKAKKAGTELSKEELELVREQAKEAYNVKHADDEANDSKKKMAEADKVVNDLVAARNQLIALNKTQTKNGDGDAANATQEKLKGVNTELQTAIDKAIEMHKAIGGPGADAAIAKLEALRKTAGTVANTIYVDWNKVGTIFASTLTSAFDTFASEVAKGTKVGEAARIAFLKFASDFLKQVANMIIQQAILNAIKAAFPGFTGAGGIGAAAGVGTAGVLHSGGTAGGVSNRSRQLDPGWFSNAVRYHTGGIAGLAPNEVPAILERGERVLSKDEIRGTMAVPGQGRGVPTSSTKIINVLDGAQMLEQALRSPAGEKVILNYVRSNPGAFKAALG